MENKLDIYNYILSPEIQQYYRKNVKLSLMEQEQIVLHSYCSVWQKTKLLRLLMEEMEGSEKERINEMLLLHESILREIEDPKERVLFVAERNASLTRYGRTDMHSIFKYVSVGLEYYESLGGIMMELAKEKEDADKEDGDTGFDLMIVDMIEFPKEGGHKEEVYFKIIWNQGEPQINRVYVDDKWIRERGFSEDVRDRYNEKFTRNILPFESGSRLKIQTPFMKKPFYGILWSELDGNGCWYHFLYEEDDKEQKGQFIDLSYSELTFGLGYAVLDWVYRGKEHKA